jgi:GLPGLI family protein
MGALSVQKARGHFRGRDYTAWFAPSIPLAGGPWKLGGLPGLILEAYDDERLVVFLFKAIQLREDLTVERPEMKTPGIDLYTYQEIFRQEVREYFRFLNARLREDGSGLSYQLGAFEMWERLDQSPNH